MKFYQDVSIWILTQFHTNIYSCLRWQVPGFTEQGTKQAKIPVLLELTI